MIKVTIYMKDGSVHEVDCQNTAFADQESCWFTCFVDDHFPIFMVPKENLNFVVQEDDEAPDMEVEQVAEKVH